MKKIFFALLMLYTYTSQAQPWRNCGTVKTDTSFLLSMAAREQDPQFRVETTTRMIKVFAHIMANDNGSSQAITEAQLQSEFQMLLSDYSSNNLCFVIVGSDIIRSTALNSNFNVDDDPSSDFDPFRVPGAINVFYVTRISGNNTSCNPPCGIGGIALGGIPGTFFLVDDGNVGGHTISHEMGHCLGLSHTFAAINGRECINGSNSLTAGDLIGDTNADPFSFDGSACYSESSNGCTYTGTCTDPCGSSAYHPPYTNIMSYWPECNSQFFSTLQYVRINTTIDSYLPVTACSAPNAFTQNATTVSSGYFIKAAIGTFTTSGTVNMTAAAMASFTGYEATVKAGFQATPSGTGYTLITAHQCN